MSHERKKPLIQYFTIAGDGTGSANMNVDGSVAPKVFSVLSPPLEIVNVYRLLILVRDNGRFDAQTFGNGIILTSGITIELITSGGTYDLLGGLPIKTNSDFGRVAYDVDVKTWGTGDEVLLSRWSLNKFIPGDSPLALEAGESLRVTVNDDLTPLVEFTIAAEGWQGFLP